MAQVPSETEDVSPHHESADAEASMRSLIYDCSSTGETVLRAPVEEYAFQALSEGLSMKRSSYRFSASEAHEGNDLLSLTFPRKLWKIVESNRFKSISWAASGTSIVINEELFKKEVLERKSPFNIFETQNMKSFARQLNLYGFRKTGKNCQRSASLADFLEEEKEASAFNKLQFYRNPNFQRGCPQLLMRMKRRVGTKNASQISASLLDLNQKLFCSGKDVIQQNTSSQDESRRENSPSTSTNPPAPQLKKPPTSTGIVNTVVPIRSFERAREGSSDSHADSGAKLHGGNGARSLPRLRAQNRTDSGGLAPNHRGQWCPSSTPAQSPELCGQQRLGAELQGAMAPTAAAWRKTVGGNGARPPFRLRAEAATGVPASPWGGHLLLCLALGGALGGQTQQRGPRPSVDAQGPG
ncbi:heat shock transcription factor, Y-linked-like [Tenrec ecaudatus]|uniref:heat shock transcription factor, Y-linked-like n=1 Tax=Tenrec ecaudatus TaxID=94439 RepID=UPI003F59980D